MTNAMAAKTTAEAPIPRPAGLGPGSLTWEFFGDYRTFAIGPRPALLQNMLPELGEGVLQHSTFFSDTLGRVRRSVGPIYETVYRRDEGGHEMGRSVRDFHRNIRGSMPDGGPYHALTPETFYWAHATFFEWVLTATDRFIRPLTRAEKEQLYEESKAWYRRYGVSDGAMPATYAEFEAYWDRMLASELVPHKTARYGIGYATRGIPRPKRFPPAVWACLSPPLNYVARLASIGGLPERARELLALPWTERDERAYRRYVRAVRAIGPMWERLPLRLRYVPPAAKALEQLARS